MTLTTLELVNSLSLSLECQVSLESMNKAVSLWPCLHTINEDSAEQTYGTIVDQKCTKIGVPCINCRIPVVSYGKNHLICQLSTEVERLKTLLEEEQKKSVEEPIKAYRRKKPKLREVHLEDHQIAHQPSHEKNDHSSFNSVFMACVGGCLGLKEIR